MFVDTTLETVSSEDVTRHNARNSQRRFEQHKRATPTASNSEHASSALR